ISIESSLLNFVCHERICYPDCGPLEYGTNVVRTFRVLSLVSFTPDILRRNGT
ncbi:hypothetical protein ACHAW6_011491, partial [Cyclotella cf. meneghiniana]